LTPDTVVNPGGLDEWVMFLNEHPQCGIVAGKLVKPDGTLDCLVNAPFKHQGFSSTVRWVSTGCSHGVDGSVATI